MFITQAYGHCLIQTLTELTYTASDEQINH